MAKEGLTSSDGPHLPIVTEDLVLNILIEVKIVVGDDDVSALPNLVKSPLLERQHQSHYQSHYE